VDPRVLTGSPRQVEQLGGENQRLKAQLAQQESHNERLRDELARVQSLAQENLGLLQTVKLLEERTRTLEGLCHDKRSELRKASEQLAGADQERQQLLLTLEGVEQDHAEAVRAHEAEQSRLRERLAQLERRAGGQHARDREWGNKLQAAEARLAAVQQENETELEQLRQDKRRLRDAGEELEHQVQSLLATTVRQTAVIEDCDRALGEARRQHASAAEGCEDQRRVVAELNAHVHKLEARAAALKRDWDDDKLRHEKVVMELESKLTKRRDKLEALRGVLQDRDLQLQDMQRDQVLRDRSRFHSDEVRETHR
jgi:chromosome segregation ATPase